MNEQKQEGFRLDYSAEIPLKETERARESSCPLDYTEVLKKRVSQRKAAMMFNLSE